MSMKQRKEKDGAYAGGKHQHYCSLREPPPRQFSPDVGGERARSIVINSVKWLNGTTLKYSFFPSTGNFSAWGGSAAQKQVVRDAMKLWTDIGIGIAFEEVSDRADAQVRIGFMKGDGHWSYLGRDVLRQGIDDRTLNLDPTAGNFDIDTAAHELGHTLGLPHEHQNPNAGIVWNEEAVYAALGAPPNNWSRETTHHNIIRKLLPNSVHGSAWDPDSVMHYAFEAGLIAAPEKYKTGLTPAGGLSNTDKVWIKQFYPPLNSVKETELKLLESQRLELAAGQQRDFVLKPKTTRNYDIQTFGPSDSVLVLYERANKSELIYLTGDDDSGEGRNALIRRQLLGGRTYVLRIRLFHAQSTGETGIMWW